MQTIKFRKYLYKTVVFDCAFQYHRCSFEEIQRSGRQVYRKNVDGGASWKYYGCCCMRTCRASHNVCSAELHAPGAGSYIVRVPSHFLPMSAAKCLDVYTRQTVFSYEGWPPRFLFAKHLTTLFSRPQKINIRDWKTGANPRSRETARTESLTRLRDAFAFWWHV